MVIPGRLTVVSWLFISAGLLSAVLVLADIYLLGYRERMRIMEAVVVALNVQSIVPVHLLLVNRFIICGVTSGAIT